MTAKTFKQFMTEVAKHMIALCGVGPYDISDYCYYDAYDAGMSAADVAVDALENDDCFSMMFGDLESFTEGF